MGVRELQSESQGSMIEGSWAQTWEITDHFCSEGELPLKGREM